MRKIFLPFLIVVFALTGCGGGITKDTDNIKQKKTYVIGLDDEYAPMGFRDETGKIVGLDIDLAKETAKRMGVEFEFRPIIWDKKEAELNSGRIDIIWNGLDITPERQTYILYSKPYMNNRQLLLVKESRDLHIKSIQDLKGKIVATQAGSNAEDYVERDDAMRTSFANFITYPTFSKAFKALAEERIDVLIVDEFAGRYEINRQGNEFKLIEIAVGDATELGIGFRRSDVELRDEVQKAFDEIIADGTAKKISEKWFQVNLIK